MRTIAILFAAALTAGAANAADRVEIVVDVSAAMWSPLPDGTPRIVAAREALEDLAVFLSATRAAPEVGLRGLAGTHDRWQGESCGDTTILAPVGPVRFADWRSAVSVLEPTGARDLVSAVTAAVVDLAPAANGRRVVVITSGEDECGGGFGKIKEVLGSDATAVEARFIGLSLRGATGADLTALAPTRIVNDTKGLAEALRWAVLPAAGRPPGERRFELRLTDSAGEEWYEVRVENQASGAVENITIDKGVARNRIPPGLYRAHVKGRSGGSLAFAGLAVGAEDLLFDVTTPAPPPVTLEAVPERPLAGGTVSIHYWGAPPGNAWVTLTPKGAPFGNYLLRQAATPGEGDVSFSLPGEILEFEAQFACEAADGGFLLCGRTSFASRLEVASIQAPERVEIATPLTIQWTGPDLAGDRIMITTADGDDAAWAACLFTGAGSPLVLAAPVVPGDYWVRYVSSGERVLARSSLEVFEILAVLTGPQAVAPGVEFTVGWEGPGGELDFVALSAPDAAPEEYLSFSPTADGPSIRLRAPDKEGLYELRYVRSSDGAVLAREELRVEGAAVSLRAPKAVEAGSRFTVEWSGAAAEGDFIALARKGSNPRQHVDFAFTSEGNSLSLAAPFKSGRYEVRYISASEGKVLASVPLVVR